MDEMTSPFKPDSIPSQDKTASSQINISADNDSRKESPLICPYERCGHKFKHVKNLQQHYRVQHSEHAQVHLCQECKTEFKYKSALTRHIRVIHANPESRRQNVKARPKHKRRRSETQSQEDICDPDEDNISFLRDSVERQREWNRLLGFGSHFILPDNCIFATGTGDGYGNEDDYHSLSSIAHPSSFPSSPTVVSGNQCSSSSSSSCSNRGVRSEHGSGGSTPAGTVLTNSIISINTLSRDSSADTEAGYPAVAKATAALKCETESQNMVQQANSLSGGLVLKEACKAFLCSYPGCGRVFTRKSNLDDHRRKTHENPGAFACPVEGCRRCFSYKHVLRRHALKVHGVCA